MKVSLNSRRRHTVIAAGLGTTLAAVLSACSPGNAMETDDMQAVAATPQESQEFIPASAQGPAENAPEPVLPELAREQTPEGAAATVEFFWEALDYGRVTGDTSHMENVSHYMCDLCADSIYRWEKVHEDDSWAVLRGASEVDVYEVHTTPGQESDDDAWTAVLFELTEPASDFYQSGELIEHETNEAVTSSGWWAELVYAEDDQRWIIDWIDYDDNLGPVDG